jgi:hypothetical protein
MIKLLDQNRRFQETLAPEQGNTATSELNYVNLHHSPDDGSSNYLWMNRLLIEKRILTQLINKLPAFYETKFIIVSKSAQN